MNSPIGLAALRRSGAAKKLFLILAALAALAIPARAQQVKTKCPNNEYPLFQTVDNADGRFVQPFCIDSSGNIDVNGASPSGKAALKPATADALQFVTAEGSDSNDGKSWGTAKATIAAAYAALPTCTPLSGILTSSPVSMTCGQIILGQNASGYNVSSAINIVGNATQIIGIGTWPVTINCLAASCINWNNKTIVYSAAASGTTGGLWNVTLNGNSLANAVGFLGTDITGLTMRHVRVVNFTGTGAIGIEVVADGAGTFSERLDWEDIETDNDTNHVVFNGTAAGQSSFEHSRIVGLNVLLENGNTGVTFSGTATLISSVLHGVCNTNGPTTNTYTCVSASSTANISGDDFWLPADNAGGGTLTICSGCTSGNFAVGGGVFNQPGSPGATQDLETNINSTGTGFGFGLIRFYRSGVGKAVLGLCSNNDFCVEKSDLSARIFEVTAGVTGGEFILSDGTNASTVVGGTGSNTYTLPATGGTFSMVISGSVAGSITALAANSCGDAVTATITGATTSMVATASPQAAISAGLILSTPFVSAANTVTVGYCNVTTASITPAAATFNIRVIQ